MSVSILKISALSSSLSLQYSSRSEDSSSDTLILSPPIFQYALEELAWNRMREWIKDSGLLNIYPVKGLFSTYKAYGGGSSIVAIRTDHGQEFDNEVQFRAYCDAQGYSQNSKAYVVLNKHTMKVKELLNVTFDESPTPTNVSPLVDDDVGEEEAIKKNTKVVNNNDEEEDESIEVDETVHVPRCMHGLDYDEHVDSLSTMDNEVEVSSPESTTQILSLFKEYTPPVTYPEEVEKTLGTPIEVEPLNETKLEEVGLNCNHNTPLSSREVPSFDKPEPQPQLLPNCPPLDVSLGEERGPEQPIKPHSPDSFRMKEVDSLTTNTPPSPHVVTFHPKDTYCYYHPCIVDPKKHYRFKPGLLGKSVSLGVDISNWEIFDDD
ncbi:hypothetical protein Tco_1007028 [Tanacetum coccineum]|uniref:Uncharacterized protein n=1 Tax=Tanacetum coccineum TaxID=301880 RepID=A0ABQ5FKK6_9ASTR